MEAILAGTETITTLVGTVFDLITSNVLLCVLMGAGLIGVGVTVFKKIKKAAH